MHSTGERDDHSYDYDAPTSERPAFAAPPPSGPARPDWATDHDSRLEQAERDREQAAEQPRDLPGFDAEPRAQLRPGDAMPTFAHRRRPPEVRGTDLPSYDTRERPVVGPDGALPTFTDRDRYRSQPSPAEPPEPYAEPTTGERVAAQVRAMWRRPRRGPRPQGRA